MHSVDLCFFGKSDRSNRRRISRLVFLFTALFNVSLPFSLQSESLSTDAEMEARVRTMVEQAHAFFLAHSGNMKAVQAAFASRPEFRDDANQLYIFMHAYSAKKKEAVCVAQGVKPALIGKNMWGLRTPNGRLLFREIVEIIEKRDTFWIEYDWLNPYTSKIGKKRSLYKKVLLKNGKNAWIGCGFWKH